MTKYLAQHQVDQYHALGFCAPIEIMSESDALLLGERLGDIEEKFPDGLAGRNRNNPHLVFQLLDEIAFNTTILDIVEDLIGSNFVLWGCVLFIKDPQTDGYVSWHQDATYMGLEPHDYVTPWLALSPSDAVSGCMSVIPGSHHAPTRKHIDTFDEKNILTRGQKILDVDESAAVDLVLRPDQASCHHPRLIHGSRPNRSDHRRIGVALQSYLSTEVRQTKGDSFAILARGEDHHHHHTPLCRPK